MSKHTVDRSGEWDGGDRVRRPDAGQLARASARGAADCAWLARRSRRARGAAVAVIAVLQVLQSASAAADADETSVHGQVLAGLVRTEDHGATGTGPMGGASGRVTVARSDRWAFELTIAGFQARLRHAGAGQVIHGVPLDGVLERTQLAGRLELGVQARFGVRWIPTIHIGAGLQVRHLGATTLRTNGGMSLASIPADTAFDLTATVGVGLDRRLGRSFVLGLNVAAVYAQPLGGEVHAMAGAEATLHLACYFYPRWFSLAGWRGSHGGGA